MNVLALIASEKSTIKALSISGIYSSISNKSRRGYSAYSNIGLTRNYQTAKALKSNTTFMSNCSSSKYFD